MRTYCLFCETSKCGCVAKTAARKLSCRDILHKQVQHTWSKGKMVDIEHDLLPGYVFLYLEEEPLNVLAVKEIDGVIRCLCDGEKRYELSGSDKQFAMMLLKKDGIIGKTKVYREGQMIRICEGAYQGLETKILKVNHQKSRMQIEIPFANLPVRTWVEFEIVQEL